MEKITSFCIDHDILEKGMYISRIDGDIITYDLRMVKPNYGTYLDNDGLHTFEPVSYTHLDVYKRQLECSAQDDEKIKEMLQHYHLI